MREAELQIVGKCLRLHKARQEPPHIDVGAKEKSLLVELIFKTRPSRSRAHNTSTTSTTVTINATTVATDVSDDASVLGGEAIAVSSHALHPKA
jgi:hypothetical protein